MRLLFFSPWLHRHYGGAERYAVRLGQELRRRGHQVQLVCAAGRMAWPEGVDLPVRALPRAARLEGLWQALLRVEQWRGGYRLGRWLSRSGLLPLWGRGAWCPAVGAPALYRDVEAVVHFHTPSSCWAWLQARALRRLPRRLPAFSVPFIHVQEIGRHIALHRRLHQDYALTVTLTAFEERFLIASGWAPSRVATMGAAADPWLEPVDPAAFRARHGLPPAAPVVLFLGRKIFNKGITHVITAMDEVWTAFPEARLVLAGFAHNSPEWLQGYVTRSRGADRTLVLDELSEAEREDALAACTVLAAPSISDSFGMVYLDAWRHGRPVIGCRQTCCEALIEDGTDGRLVSFGAVAQLAEALRGLLAQPAEAQRMGANGKRKWQGQYQWTQVADRFETALTRAVDQGLQGVAWNVAAAVSR